MFPFQNNKEDIFFTSHDICAWLCFFILKAVKLQIQSYFWKHNRKLFKVQKYGETHLEIFSKKIVFVQSVITVDFSTLWLRHFCVEPESGVKWPSKWHFKFAKSCQKIKMQKRSEIMAFWNDQFYTKMYIRNGFGKVNKV